MSKDQHVVPGAWQTKFNWKDAISMLQAGTPARQRPAHLSDAECCHEQVFLEIAGVRRRKGDDKWMTSGGEKGATELWAEPGEVGALKRYGRIVRRDLLPLRFSQYTLLGQGAERQGSTLWVVRPLLSHLPAGSDGPHEVPPLHSTASNPPFAHSPATSKGTSVKVEAAAPLRLAAPTHALGQATVEVQSSSMFISFQSGRSGEEGLELGSVVRKHEAGGVTLQSSQGDFAEWYKLAARQAPFEEGDVVGFSGGKITRKTTGCAMLGIVSRKAVVEGSAPPPSERHLYDTVAHCGVVPVKLSLCSRWSGMKCECPTPYAGQLLTPSGLHDGTAVLVPATESVSRVGILLDATTGPEHGASDAQANHGESGGYVLATALVTAPTETVPRSTVVWARQLRRVVFAMLWLLASLAIALVLVSHLENAGHVSYEGTEIVAPTATENVTPTAAPEPEPEPAPEVINGPSCNCGHPGTCSADSCFCDDHHLGKFCNGTEWRYGKMGQSCSEVCAVVVCSDGDWGANSKISMRMELIVAGVDPSTLCDHWSRDDFGARIGYPGANQYVLLPCGCVVFLP